MIDIESSESEKGRGSASASGRQISSAGNTREGRGHTPGANLAVILCNPMTWAMAASHPEIKRHTAFLHPIRAIVETPEKHNGDVQAPIQAIELRWTSQVDIPNTTLQGRNMLLLAQHITNLLLKTDTLLRSNHNLKRHPARQHNRTTPRNGRGWPISRLSTNSNHHLVPDPMKAPHRRR